MTINSIMTDSFSFSDIFKSSFLENITAVSVLDMALTIALALGIGIFIFFVYKKTYQGVMYSSSFGTTLIALTMITSQVILAVTSNVVLSLGMVGALSIVRFRTAIKDPLDLVFLFWAISIGIICGAGLSLVAVALSVVVSLLLWIFNALPIAKAPVLLLVSSGDLKGEADIVKTAEAHCKAVTMKSRNLTTAQLDLIMEVRTEDEAALTAAIMALSGVTACSVVAHDGEVTF